MKRIKVMRNGVQTHGAELDDDKYQAWIDLQVAANSWGQVGEYQVVIEDMTAEIADKKAKADARQARRDRITTLTKKASLTAAEVTEIMVAIAKELLNQD